jgi:hypothetical protein
LLNSVSLPGLALLALVILVPIGLLSNHLLVSIGLYFPISPILLALAIGAGGACLGWVWSMPLSNRSRLMRVLLILAGMALMLVVVWQLDRVFLSITASSDRVIVSDIPGVHLEASGGYKTWHAVSSPPPYWLITIGYTLLIAVISSLIWKTFVGGKQNAG